MAATRVLVFIGVSCEANADGDSSQVACRTYSGNNPAQPAARRVIPANLGNALTFRGMRDELFEAALARLLALGTHDPESHEAPIARCLGLEELPRAGLGAEAPQVPGRKDHVAVLGRVEAGALGVALFVGIQARLRHESRGLELLDLLQVDGAPDPPCRAGGEALLVRVLVVALGAPVDPAVAERLFDRLFVRESLLPARGLAEPAP